MLCILIWALMVLALMERQVRRILKGRPLYGLYLENRPSPAPTGPAILQCFANWCVVIVKHHGRTMRRLGEASDTQRRLLVLLDIPPTVSVPSSAAANSRALCNLAIRINLVFGVRNVSNQ